MVISLSDFQTGIFKEEVFMKKFLTVLLIVIMVLQSGIVAMGGYKPMFSYSSWNGGRAIKSDLTLWDFEYKSSSKRVNLEKIDDDVIFIEDNGTFRMNSDNSLWLYQTDYTKCLYPVKIEKKLMFEKYGFSRGGDSWPGTKGYMHFSYRGT